MSTTEERVNRALTFQTEPVSAHTIWRLTKGNYNTIRVTLRRMHQAGTVKQTEAGLYASSSMMITDTGMMRELLQMHGIQLSAPCNIEQRGLSFEAASDVTRAGHRHRVNQSWTYTEEWDSRIVSVTHHQAAEVVLISLMSGDAPLDYHDMLSFCSFLQGRFPQILASQWEVVQLGINYDTSRIGLQGIQKVSLQQWKDIWFNIYRRQDGKVRIEMHTTKKMSLAEVLETFSLFVKVTETPPIVRK